MTTTADRIITKFADSLGLALAAYRDGQEVVDVDFGPLHFTLSNLKDNADREVVRMPLEDLAKVLVTVMATGMAMLADSIMTGATAMLGTARVPVPGDAHAEILARWTDANTRRAAYELEAGPLSELLDQAALHLHKDDDEEAGRCLDAFEERRAKIAGARDLLLTKDDERELGAENEVDAALLVAVTERWRKARKQRASFESGTDGPLRRFVTFAAQAIDENKPGVAADWLDSFEDAVKEKQR
jgi:hypothetical protein